MYLVCDTETCGLKADAAIAQIAFLLFDKDRKVVGQFKSLIKPDGWVMPPETAAFHGITQEICEKYGMDIRGVLSVFNGFCARADMLIFHNSQYDVGRLQYTMQKIGFPLAMPRVSCTMKLLTDFIKLPPTEKMVAAGRGGYKAPNLKEAHKFCTGEDFDGAHDALADVQACAKVWWWLLDHQAQVAA